MESFELDGSTKFVEVKTTRDGAETPFFISSHEVEFAKRHSAQYALYRIYAFDMAQSRGRFYISRGSLMDDRCVALEPVVFRARVSADSLAPNITAT